MPCDPVDTGRRLAPGCRPASRSDRTSRGPAAPTDRTPAYRWCKAALRDCLAYFGDNYQGGKCVDYRRETNRLSSSYPTLTRQSENSESNFLIDIEICCLRVVSSSSPLPGQMRNSTRKNSVPLLVLMHPKMRGSETNMPEYCSYAAKHRFFAQFFA